LGFHIRVTGYNIKAAQYAGIRKEKVILSVFLIGGVCAGLAGALHVMGRPPTYAIYSGMPAITGLGFSGMAVSMIGRNHPIGIILSAIFFGGLLAGGRMMQITAKVPLEMVNMVMGLIVVFLAVPPEKLLEIGKKIAIIKSPAKNRTKGKGVRE
jgi:simple sugar transport system permease protein